MENRIFGIETEYGCLPPDSDPFLSPDFISVKAKDCVFYRERLGIVDLHYRGRGCHLRATEADGAESEFDLYPHHFDALHPGTKHMAYNLNETSSCENLNMMLADPSEVLPPKSGHKPKPR